MNLRYSILFIFLLLFVSCKLKKDVQKSTTAESRVESLVTAVDSSRIDVVVHEIENMDKKEHTNIYIKITDFNDSGKVKTVREEYKTTGLFQKTTAEKNETSLTTSAQKEVTVTSANSVSKQDETTHAVSEASKTFVGMGLLISLFCIAIGILLLIAYLKKRKSW